MEKKTKKNKPQTEKQTDDIPDDVCSKQAK